MEIIWLTPAQLLAKINSTAADQRISQPPLCKQLLYQHPILNHPAKEPSTHLFGHLGQAEVLLLLDGLVHEVKISEGLQLNRKPPQSVSLEFVLVYICHRLFETHEKRKRQASAEDPAQTSVFLSFFKIVNALEGL